MDGGVGVVALGLGLGLGLGLRGIPGMGGMALGWDHRVALGGMARLDSTKKLEMIVMIISNFAIYTSTHYFSPSYAKGHRSCTHIYRRKDSWEWIESTLGYPEPPDLQPQLPPWYQQIQPHPSIAVTKH